MTCTWKGCTEEADYPQLDRHGNEWANLCIEHHNELDISISNSVDKQDKKSIKKVLSSWIKAVGGAKKMSERM